MLAERLRAVYACETNLGIRAISDGEHGHSEDDPRYARRRYLSADIANGYPDRQRDLRHPAPADLGCRSSAVASDSTHFEAFDQSIFTEWHSRSGGRGVLIYWHVEKKTMAIHSQVINCSASEVAAMIEGTM